MPKLVLDIGNTRAKWAVFDKGKLFDVGVFLSEKTQEELQNVLERYQPSNAIYASVRADKPDWLLFLETQITTETFTTNLPTLVQNQYLTPHTLGVDRWAAALGVYEKYKNQNCLIVDAGTCITLDILTKDAQYLGGAISPGISMRLQAMHQFTGKLPLISYDFDEDILPLIGASTVAALKAGAVRGCVAEMIGWYHELIHKYDNITVIATGGDGAFLVNQLKKSNFAASLHYEPHLVLEGIHSVLK